MLGKLSLGKKSLLCGPMLSDIFEPSVKTIFLPLRVMILKPDRDLLLVNGTMVVFDWLIFSPTLLHHPFVRLQIFSTMLLAITSEDDIALCRLTCAVQVLPDV